jgi:peptidoglycan/LPS O-acetylase OafA/YrhL
MTTTVASLRRRAGAPSPAVAPPPGNPRFPLFDSLRALAVLAVVVNHVFLLTGALERRRGLGELVSLAGSLAPTLFFAISGFLLYRPWVAAGAAGKRGPSTGRYLRRRALRILPAYWFALTALAIWPGIAGPFSGDWWRYYFLLQLYDSRALGLGIPVVWTLCVEVTFYLLLPLWAGLVARARTRAQLAALAALAAAGAAFQVAAGRQAIAHVVAVSLPGQLPWFAVGMAFAVVSVAVENADGALRARIGVVASRPLACWAGAVVAFAALAVVRHNPGGLLGILKALSTPQPYPRLLADVALTGLLVVLVLMPAVWDKPARLPQRLLAWAPLAALGVVSYGVFLWHLTIAELLILPEMPLHFDAGGLDLVNRIPQGATPICLVLTLAVSWAVAALSYRFVELPFLRRKEG